MSRSTEILRRYPPWYFDQFEKPPATEPLFPRFERVVGIVEASLTENPPPGITREIRNTNWSGFDFGSHDHRGTIKGTSSGGVMIDLTIKGSTFDNQGEIGEIWKLTRYKRQYLNIDGVFVSSDNRTGCLSLVKINGEYDTQAFWMKNIDGKMELRQVVNSKGETYDANKLKNFRGKITVPNSQVTIPIYR